MALATNLTAWYPLVEYYEDPPENGTPSVNPTVYTEVGNNHGVLYGPLHPVGGFMGLDGRRNQSGINRYYTNAYNCTLGRTSHNTGYKFHGDTYIDLNQNFGGNLNAFSLSAWVYPSLNIGETGTIFSRYWSTVGMKCYSMSVKRTSTDGYEWTFSVYDSNQMATTLTATTTNAYYAFRPVVFVKSGTTIKIYVEGQEKASRSDAPLNINICSYSYVRTMIGAVSKSNSTPDLFYKGLMCQVGVWDRALTSFEISDLYRENYPYASDGNSYPFKATPVSNISAQAVSNTQINLNWTNTAPIFPYLLRINHSGGSIMPNGIKVYRDGIRIGLLSETATSFQDLGLNPNTTYSYYLIGYNGCGDGYASLTVYASTTGSSVSCSPSSGTISNSGGTLYTTITSSGYWSASIISDPYNIIAGINPMGGVSGQQVAIDVYNGSGGASAIIRFTCGANHADFQVTRTP